MSRKVIGIAAAIYGVSILLSRLIGLIRESVIGRTLGATGEADVYWTAFVLPDFLNYLLAGGVLSIVFIPIFSRYLAEEDEPGGWVAFSNIANSLTGLLIIATAALWLMTPQITPWIQPGWDPERLNQLNELIRIILPAQIFHLVGGLISATLQARDKHLMPALAPLLYTLSIIAGGLWLGPTMGAKGFAWGVLVGSVLGPFGLPLLGAIKHGLRWHLSLNFGHPDLRHYFLLSFPVMLGFSVIVFDDMLVKHFGSWMAEGVISQLQYAKTLMKVPMGVFGLAFGMATFPTLSRLFAEDKPAEASKLLIDAVAFLIVLAWISQAALFAASTEMAEVIWGRSKFELEALSRIGQYTSIMGLGLWAWSAHMLVARGFYAQSRTWIPTVVGSLMTIIAYPLYLSLAKELGPLGLAWSSTIIVSIYVFALFGVYSRSLRLGWAPAARLGSLLVRMGLSATVGGLAGVFLSQSVIHNWPALPRGFAAGVIAMALTAACASLSRVEEVSLVVQKLKARLSRDAS